MKLALLALLSAFVIVAGAGPAAAPSVYSQRPEPFEIDDSLAYGTVSGSVAGSDPAAAVIRIKNEQHFWKGIRVHSASGGAAARPGDIARDPRNLWANIGVLAPGASTTYDASFVDFSSVTIVANYDAISVEGRAAFGMTCLQILAEVLGGRLKAAPQAVKLAIQVLTEVPEYLALLDALEEGESFGISRSLLAVLSSESGSEAFRVALEHLGLIVDVSEIRKLSGPLGAWSFVEMMASILKATAEGGNSMGTLTFSYRPASASPSATALADKTVRDVDWKNREYDFDGERITVVNGRLELPPKAGMPVSYSVQEAAAGDLTGDGREEIVIAQTWSPGTMHALQAAQVFGVKDGVPVLLLDLETGSRAFGGVAAVRIERGRLYVSRYEGQAACCPTHQVTHVYVWNGSALVEDPSAITRVPVASPSPASGDVEKANAAAVEFVGGPLVPPPLTTDACRKANPPPGKGCVEQIGESETLRRGYAVLRASNPPEVGGGGTLILGRTASGAWGYYFSQQQPVKPGALPATGRICSIGGLNVRDRPSADGAVLAVLPDDSLQSLDRFELVEGSTGQGWFAVRTSDGAGGWVAAAYVYSESWPCSAASVR